VFVPKGIEIMAPTPGTPVRPKLSPFVRPLMPALSRAPWRSVWLPRAATAVALVVGLPLFLRSPPWCDVTLYQMAARNLLHGGTHFKDLFDTNLPGFVWVTTALYWLFGPSTPAVRVVDLLVVAGVVALIDRLAKWGGATPAARWWAIAGAALFYPFTTEMSHAQRDTWMALPGLAAVALRLRRIRRAESIPPAPLAKRDGVGPSFVEGLLWGTAVWMKPHIALMALTVWLVTAWRLAADRPRPRRAVAADLFGNLLGGLAVGAPGVLWMVATGAWDPFLTVFLEWNPYYMRLANEEFAGRLELELHWFPPWSLGLVLTVPLALLSVADAAPWRGRARAAAEAFGPVGRRLPPWLWDGHAGPGARFVRGALGALYLAWAAQALFVQRQFLYVHVPETLLMFGLWAAHRWALVPVGLLWLALTSGLWVAADFAPDTKARLDRLPPEAREHYLPRHVITSGARLRLWPQCWRPTMSDAERYALWDKLRLHPPHEASICWEEMGEVAEFLRARGVRDGEVVAWFDSPHVVYLMLDIDPGLRYMHVFTVLSIVSGMKGSTHEGREMILREAEARGARCAPGRPRYAITDLEWVATMAGDDPDLRAAALGPPHNPPWGLMPTYSPYPKEFPFNQHTLFRTRNGTGRYVVHIIHSYRDHP
jgi:hypothetical protein